MRFCAATLQESLHKDLEPFILIGDFSWSHENTPQEVACYRLKESLLKKFNNEKEPSPLACSRALKKFEDVNRRMSEWSPLFRFEWEAELYGEFKAVLADLWCKNQEWDLVNTWSECFFSGRVGPGASIGCTYYDFYSKMFTSPHTTTQALADIWPMCIERSSFSDAYDTPQGDFPLDIVEHSKLSFVNKNQAIARTICTEPLVNMWLQLGFGVILENNLKRRFGIDFEIQPEVNAALARLGSLNDQLITIDLESASDSLGLPLLENILPRRFLSWLRAMRSPATRLPDGRVVQLNMVSTMGNGFTFPLMTTIFTAACVATYRYLGIQYVSSGPWLRRNLAVFGDDIIVDKRIHRTLVRFLELLGFVVNTDKSFVEGRFRESCGVDAFLGVNVRPVYLKRLRSIQDACVAINRLNRWSAIHGVPLRHTVRYILSCYPKATSIRVPLDEADDSGIRTPLRLLSHRPRSVKGSQGLLRYTSFVPEFFGYKGVRGSLGLHPSGAGLCPRGLELAFIGGYVSGYRVKSADGLTSGWRVSLRQRDTRYITKRRVTPRWDYLPPEAGVNYDVARFATACQWNM